jgi:hypothetical protein
LNIRTVYEQTAVAVGDFIAGAEVRAAWTDPSALEEWDVAGLCGHLTRAITAVGTYLSAPVPDANEVIDAAGYLMSFDGLGADGGGPDLGSDLHRSIRARGSEAAAAGHEELTRQVAEKLPMVMQRVAQAPADRAVAVIGSRVMLLDQYLETRLLELLVHSDDLAASVGVDLPSFPTPAWRITRDLLVEVATRRHGAAAVVRAMTRTERDTVRALRVL